MKTLLLSLIALCLLVIASASQIKGVNPNDLMKYQGSEFSCFDGSGKIPRHKINDNYCDCKDGSDEPGTSACSGQSKVKFYCPNKGYIPKSIFVNFVNDGICDCCDGSDEYEGRVSCPNTCRVEGEGLRKQYTEQLSNIQRGLQKKQENAQEGTRQLKQIRQNLKDKKEKLTGLEAELGTLEAEKQRLEKQEEDEKNKIREQKKQEEEAAAAVKQAEEAAQQPPAEQAQQQEGVEPAVVPPVLETKPPAEDAAKDYKNEEAQKARDAYDAKKRDVDNLRSEISQLENTVSLDFGPNNEFFYLKDKCLSIDTREYTYEFCAYNKCAQKDKRHSSQTSLGSWNNNSWVQKYTSMKFENGQGCWQGPNRSTTVTFACAPEDKVVKVDEPSRCVYSLLVETPSVCTTEAEQEIASKLADLN